MKIILTSKKTSLVLGYSNFKIEKRFSTYLPQHIKIGKTTTNFRNFYQKKSRKILRR
jgi:hypothetical protein